mmetsp:Transcript_53293/g.141180  ORF Transcript_53293/g.141180 Transcript_53293/m.141180 type:complete len:373 (-) Transcript_53293:98-1216(-)
MAATASSVTTNSVTTASVTTTSVVRRRDVLDSMPSKKQADRIEKMASELAGGKDAPQWAKDVIKVLAPLASKAAELIDKAAPHIIMASNAAYKFYCGLSSNVITAIYGIILCFFGGMFPVAIAAAEAFRVSGGERVVACLKDMCADVQQLLEADAADNKKDDDHDGVADVDQLNSKALLSRKIRLGLATVNPDRLLHAFGGITQACCGVLVVVRMQFARTISFAVCMSDHMHKLSVSLAGPVLVRVVPPDLHKWISPMLMVACKLVSMSLAWFIQSVVSAVQSAMVGGMMAGRGIIDFIGTQPKVKDFLEKNFKLKLSSDTTFADEALGVVLTLLGLYFQLSNGMHLPFPVSLVLFPLSLFEYFLEWVVTWG